MKLTLSLSVSCLHIWKVVFYARSKRWSPYKASLYNYSVPLDEKSYVWMNGVTGGAFKVNHEVHAQVQAILANPRDCDVEQNRSLYDQLISLGFLIEEDFDEIGFLKLRHRIARYGTGSLGLGIMLTLDCNFACPYCYQPRVDKWMSHELQRGLVRYVNKMMESKHRLVIEWFGGEPLLGIAEIRELSERFLQICEKNRAHYAASITTNGYLLSEQIARELSQLGVRNAQVTIDGPPDIHNRRRILRDGRPTFDTILRNLQGAVKHIPEVALRVNLDKTNIDRFPELLTYLSPLKERIWVGIAPVAPIRAAQGYKERCFQRNEYIEVETRLEQLLKDEGFASLIGLTSDRRWLPFKSLFCGAYQADSYMIDPDGYLYKCVGLAGEATAKVGTLLPEGEVTYDWDKLLRWLTWEPFDDPACFECSVLPLCFGGCHADRLYPGFQAGKKVLPCPEVRYDLACRLQWKFGSQDASRKEVKVL